MSISLLSTSSLSAEKARRSFALFVKEAWPIIEPGRVFVSGWHLDCIAEHLQAVNDGRIRRLLVNMPPRHGKSSLISALWSGWLILNNPSIRLLCGSYAMDLATRDNLKARRIIKSNWFQERYSHVFQLTKDQDAKKRFETNKLGYRMATSVGSSTTGEGGDILILDDPHNIKEKESEAKRAAALDWFDNTWATRLNDQQTGAMVVVGQRVHAEDVSGHILATNDGEWVHLNLPTEFEAENRCHTSLGWSDPRKEEGELLWPAKFPASVVERAKKRHGSMGFAALYQQRPVPAGGGVFKQSWIRYFAETNDAYILEKASGPVSILKSACRIFATVDLAISSKQEADYTVFAIWARTSTNDLILLELIRVRIDNPEQLKQLRLLRQRYPTVYFKIESVAYQLALIQQALAEGIPCKEYKPAGKGDKVARASSFAIWMENEKAFFRKQAAYLGEFLPELLMFPRAPHDDQVDVCSMAADEVTMPGQVGGMLMISNSIDTDESEYDPLWQ